MVLDLLFFDSVPMCGCGVLVELLVECWKNLEFSNSENISMIQLFIFPFFSLLGLFECRFQN